MDLKKKMEGMLHIGKSVANVVIGFPDRRELHTVIFYPGMTTRVELIEEITKDVAMRQVAENRAGANPVVGHIGLRNNAMEDDFDESFAPDPEIRYFYRARRLPG